MVSMHAILDWLGHGAGAGAGSGRLDPALPCAASADFNDNVAARHCAGRDPYFSQACETRQLVSCARLVSSVDGNPAAVLNMNAVKYRTAA